MFYKNHRYTRTLLTSFVAGLFLTICAVTHASKNLPDVEFDQQNGTLTVFAQQVALDVLLHHVADAVGFESHWVDFQQTPPTVDVSLADQPVLVVLEELTSGLNRMIIYNEGGSDKHIGHLAQLWILGAEDSELSSGMTDAETAALTLSTDPLDSKSRSQSALRLGSQATGSADAVDSDEARQQLMDLLVADDNALVRSRAAIALGALGDPAAVDALEAAMHDANFSTRVQAINALGQIGGVRATDSLGNYLLDAGNRRTERIVAAQSLWKLDTERAREYLRQGTKVSDAAVSTAASEAPATSLPGRTGQTGTDEAS